MEKGGGGGVLLKICALKDMLDQVNKEVELQIQRTREIELNIVLSFEREKELARKESQLMSIIDSKTFNLDNLMMMFDVSKKAVDITEEILAQEEKSRREVERIDNDREDFIYFCRQFQLNLKTTKKAQVYNKLLLKRKCLEENMLVLKKRMNFHCVEEEKNNLKFQSFIHGFHGESYKDNDENMKLVKDIYGLKTALQDVNDFEDNSWMQSQIDASEEEKRQLQDCILGFQIQLSHLLDEGQRLANAYKEQLIVLALLEHEKDNRE